MVAPIKRVVFEKDSLNYPLGNTRSFTHGKIYREPGWQQYDMGIQLKNALGSLQNLQQ